MKMFLYRRTAKMKTIPCNLNDIIRNNECIMKGFIPMIFVDTD